MKFILNIDMNNDAFVDDAMEEVSHCLQRVISGSLVYGVSEGRVLDSNGNTVGSFTTTTRKSLLDVSL